MLLAEGTGFAEWGASIGKRVKGQKIRGKRLGESRDNRKQQIYQPQNPEAPQRLVTTEFAFGNEGF